MFGLLLSSLLVGSISADVVPSASVSFPQFGAVQSIEGIITFRVGADNKGVEIISNSENGLSGFPKDLGPFLWHVHNFAIPESNQTCLAAGPHFDPDTVGDSQPCNPLTPEKCQFGDLAGKYGNIDTDPFIFDQTDQFLSLDSANKGYFVGKSVVIHAVNGTRIACANIVAADSSPSSTSSAGSAATGTSGGGLPSESASTTPNSESGTTAPPSFQNGAEHLAFGSLLGWIVVGFSVGGLLV